MIRGFLGLKKKSKKPKESNEVTVERQSLELSPTSASNSKLELTRKSFDATSATTKKKKRSFLGFGRSKSKKAPEQPEPPQDIESDEDEFELNNIIDLQQVTEHPHTYYYSPYAPDVCENHTSMKAIKPFKYISV